VLRTNTSTTYGGTRRSEGAGRAVDDCPAWRRRHRATGSCMCEPSVSNGPGGSRREVRDAIPGDGRPGPAPNPVYLRSDRTPPPGAAGRACPALRSSNTAFVSYRTCPRSAVAIRPAVGGPGPAPNLRRTVSTCSPTSTSPNCPRLAWGPTRRRPPPDWSSSSVGRRQPSSPCDGKSAHEHGLTPPRRARHDHAIGRPSIPGSFLHLIRPPGMGPD